MPEIGFLFLAWWVPLVYMAIAGHLTNAATTIYLHRGMTHNGVKLHAIVSVPMRIWLWLTTGIITKQWVACHRKHHAFADRDGDPHSPILVGLKRILFGGWYYYRRASRDPEVLRKYGKGCPEDWLERWVFSKLQTVGVVILLAINIYLMGVLWGLGVWLAQVLWSPALGGVVNGIGHVWGYRNFNTKDGSRNFFPVGFLLGGEELHNNHHSDPKSARFRRRWFELDVGWVYIRVLSWFGLAKVLHTGR